MVRCGNCSHRKAPFYVCAEKEGKITWIDRIRVFLFGCHGWWR